MSENLPVKQMPLPEAIEKALISGDLSGLTPEHRVMYYNRTCDSVGLNPLTKPFDYIKNKQTQALGLYANKNCGEQLRKIHNISLTITNREKIDSTYIVTARATMPNGRTDESTGAVDLRGLNGEYLANALMKCETKAKRRVTLSVVGLGMLDESEVTDNPQVFTKIELDVTSAPTVGQAITHTETASVVVEGVDPNVTRDYVESLENRARGNEPSQTGGQYYYHLRPGSPNFEEMKTKLKKAGFKWDSTAKAWIGDRELPELQSQLNGENTL